MALKTACQQAVFYLVTLARLSAIGLVLPLLWYFRMTLEGSCDP
jgi:hypothetical protein